jgi:hypothetical protein
MVELCPTGHEDSPFFLFLLMQCLPKELRIVLGEVDDHKDVRAMAVKAEKLWSLHNHQQHYLVHVLDQVSKRRFLVDTGASYSIFPHWSSSPPTGPLLAGPSGTAIPCWGEKRI